MKITSEHIGRLLEARLERIHRASQPPRQFSIDRRDPDRVSFSARADDLRAALAAARATDDVADPAVEALRADVAAGRYQPPARAVADSMLRDLMG